MTNKNVRIVLLGLAALGATACGVVDVGGRNQVSALDASLSAEEDAPNADAPAAAADDSQTDNPLLYTLIASGGAFYSNAYGGGIYITRNLGARWTQKAAATNANTTLPPGTIGNTSPKRY